MIPNLNATNGRLTHDRVPDNVIFEIDDIESEWLWPENHFDLIHSRIMIGAIGGWKKMIRRSFKYATSSLTAIATDTRS